MNRVCVCGISGINDESETKSERVWAYILAGSSTGIIINAIVVCARNAPKTSMHVVGQRNFTFWRVKCNLSRSSNCIPVSVWSLAFQSLFACACIILAHGYNWIASNAFSTMKITLKYVHCLFVITRYARFLFILYIWSNTCGWTGAYLNKFSVLFSSLPHTNQKRKKENSREKVIR